ncbi:MAG: quinolinate synthase NadA [Thermoanaerobacteraceae bacterium]|uniref:quinolinate synthase NadA n=1 Tax=Thermanaeromonas sp. C210 TaxID=2731925 RepID=UPI00155D414E|nr:quinolinate synthase NadA [Thermanaeromonas sp. C210]MBE3580239.1 quinolinate synthase NadA [Thermoanaerobacteraceae bacterium]GFN22927.1 quinolinate synthase A [Thermanaeromonas sp. C210]
MEELVKEIEELKRERGAVILAHNYQPNAVQDIADFVGDSLALSRMAATTPARVIVLAGVRFMAESASILAPEKTILLPDPFAGCPLADTVDAEGLRRARERYPDAAVVCYVNSPAEVKAESDICCTSSNALKVVQSLPHRRVLFVPDRNLAHYVSRFTDKEIIPWEGSCLTHCRVTPEEVEEAKAAHPEAKVLVHPECRPEVVEAADFVGSTGGILRFARESLDREFLIGTEMGIIHRLEAENPGKKFYLLSPGLICPNMKLTSLAKIAQCLREMKPVVKVPEPVRSRAYGALERMLKAV